MARISYVEKDQAAPEVQPSFERFAKALGRIPNIFKAMAHAPVFFQKFWSTGVDPTATTARPGYATRESRAA